MREEAYSELRRLIIAGLLEPGERLRDQEIARWLGVSRTPVREALTRLSDEGFVELVPNRYTRVRVVGRADTAEMFPLATSLQALAAELAASVMEGPQLAQLRNEAERYSWALLREDGEELVAADDSFHRLVVEFAGNSALAVVIDRLVPRLRWIELALGGFAGQRPDPHQAIVAALAAKDAVLSARLVSDEWRSLGRLVAEGLSSSTDTREADGHAPALQRKTRD